MLGCENSELAASIRLARNHNASAGKEVLQRLFAVSTTPITNTICCPALSQPFFSQVRDTLCSKPALPAAPPARPLLPATTPPPLFPILSCFTTTPPTSTPACSPPAASRHQVTAARDDDQPPSLLVVAVHSR